MTFKQQTVNQQTFDRQTFSHLIANQRKRMMTAVVGFVTFVFIGASTASYAQHDNYSDEIVAGALIGAVVGLSLVSHGDRYNKHYDRHRKHQKYHFHGDHRCYKRHKAHKRHQQHHNSHYRNNNNHRGYQHGHSQHSSWQHNSWQNKKRRADREVHHYYNDQRTKRHNSHSKQQSRHQSKHQSTRQANPRSNEGYVSVRHF